MAVAGRAAAPMVVPTVVALVGVTARAAVVKAEGATVAVERAVARGG